MNQNANLSLKAFNFNQNALGTFSASNLSASLLAYETLNLDVNYKWGSSINSFYRIQTTSKFDMGYAYDLNTNKLSDHNSDTAKISLNNQLISKVYRLKSPRFF